MKHIQFLRDVAITFLNNAGEDLCNYCFVFPNRRSCLFFQKYLKEEADEAKILPGITTISEFVVDTTQMIECGRIELLLDLYEEYVKLAGENSESFDDFSYWGDVILNDFNDVDLYMVNSKELFRNLRELKEIGTDYLDEDQKKVIREYFGESYALSEYSQDSFWKHSQAYNDTDSNTKQYFKLWEMLGVLYDNLNRKLDNKGVTYSGRIYRNAVNRIESSSEKDFSFKKYIFVGFNVLSTSEIKIFEALKKKGIADFYWDYNSPALIDDKNKATRFIKINAKNFPSEYELNEPKINDFPHISVKAIPTNVGQVKYATKIVNDLIENNLVQDKHNLLDTAIVLPDENLFVPLSGSFDVGNNKTNITLGFPLKKSLTATLLSLVAKLHRQSRKIQGEWNYYIEDIKELLSHPFFKLDVINHTQSLLKELGKEHPFYVQSNQLLGICKEFDILFEPIEEKNARSLIKYVSSMMVYIENMIIPSFEGDSKKSVERSCALKYIEQFGLLVELISKYNIEFNDNTFFYLIDRFVSGQTISLQGEPLEGLQIMGVLETRCLDFKNVIILSMNERVFPRKHFSRSFIPYSIRKGFGLSTIEHQESMYAYYFYRMISKAENVFLLYDARTTGLGSGDPSRFIQQLYNHYGKGKIKIDFVSFGNPNPSNVSISVPKTDRVMECLSQYQKGGNGYLSASSINSYITCPLKFYFEKVEHLHIDDEPSEFMEARTFGTIIHEIMKRIYEKAPQRKVTQSYIQSYLNNNGIRLNDVIVNVVNEIYYKKGEFCNDALDGMGYMVFDVIKLYVTQILKLDFKGDFTYIKGEEKEQGYWEELGINFTQLIDRLDYIEDGENSFFRIIDYKTGKDSTVISRKDEKLILTSDSKAVNQVLMYCHFYAYLNGKDNLRIKPEIYTVRDLSNYEVKVSENKKRKVVNNYIDYSADFMDSLKNIVNEIFDKNIPFTQCEDENKCEYCKFKGFCAK